MLRQVLTDAEQVALRVVEQAEAELLAGHPFLASAVGSLMLVPGTYARDFVCDGYALGFDAARVLDTFCESGTPPVADVLHCVMHCLFMHPYVGKGINKPCWNLACDMAVERQVAELLGPRPGERGAAQAQAIAEASQALGCRLTAERLYNRLVQGEFRGHLSDWSDLFRVDDHDVWYPLQDSKGEAHEDDDAEGGDEADTKHSANKRTEGRPDEDALGKGADNPAASPDFMRKTQGSSTGSAITDAFSDAHGLDMREISRGSTSSEEDSWRRTGRALAEDIRTASSARAAKAESLAAELEDLGRPKADYRAFLRQFAVPGEVMRLSQDEFDYVYYTYGLKLYGKMPLIEPLEYREEKRIREFVIVIDTSGSVWGTAVKRFIDTTFEVLSSTESFFDKVAVRILQCDAEVLADDLLTSLDDLRNWSRKVSVRGGGGTDFRPAFRYVDGLIASGDMPVPTGLIYFTDGKGIYPEARPEYKTAFVFYDMAYRANLVPPWAIQVLLEAEALDGSPLMR